MADDLYGMLYGNLTTERKLMTAVTNNMACSVHQLITECTQQHGSAVSLIDTPLQPEIGRTALHIAASRSSGADMVRILVEGGADVTKRDLFMLTPCDLALRNGNVSCVKILLEHDSRPCWECLSTVWPGMQNILNDLHHSNVVENNNPTDDSLRLSGIITWLAQVKDSSLLRTLTIAATRIDGTHVDFALERLYIKTFEKFLDAYMMTGNRLDEELITKILSRLPDLQGVISKHHCQVQSLQHYARISIRRHVTPNVYYASKRLSLPTCLSDYLVFLDQTGTGLL